MNGQMSGIRTIIASLLLMFLAAPAMVMAALPETAGPVAAAQPAIPAGKSIPWSELGTFAGKQYSGEALSVTATETGVRLRSDFQHLHGVVTEQGLALESTVSDQPREHFTLRADMLGRVGENAIALPRFGRVETRNNLAHWLRPGVVEEYSVSVDGVRQDFLITERPGGNGPLRLEMALSGARAETANYGVDLKLDVSGRKLAYSRLKAWDATGRELPARMAVSAPDRLTIVVEDTGAVWPVRIDPTFSDANWVSMGDATAHGTNNYINALVFDNSGNLYAGGTFTTAGGVSANYIAKWNGSAWSALGAGLDGGVNALAFYPAGGGLFPLLYVGGGFNHAGNVAAKNIAMLDINTQTWSALGSGRSNQVIILAIDGSGNLYAADYGGIPSHIAKWDGIAWSAIGGGLNGAVDTLAIDGSGKLYAGGSFTTADDGTGYVGYYGYIAKWNGSTWSSLGGGMDSDVWAMAFDHSGNLYAGGQFTNAGNVSANHIAKWNGSVWSPLDVGLNNPVRAIAFDGSGNLYAGGTFTNAGGVSANRIATWDGSAWTALGSGLNNFVYALAFDGSGSLYVGGNFTTAGVKNSSYFAKAVFSVTAYSLTYDGNSNTSGSVPVDPNTYAAGASVTVLGNTGGLVKAGFTFAGWNTIANGTGTSYAAGATFTIGAANVTLYAQWTLNQTYSVTYNGNASTGGSVPVDGTAYAAGAKVTVLGNTGILVKNGYNFAGWNSAANGSGTSYAAGAIFTMGAANVTLYAQWTVIPVTTYTLVYTAGANGTISGVTPQTVNSGASGTPVTAVPNQGYHFIQWSDGSLANPRTDTNVTGNISVTAVFAIISPPALNVSTLSDGAITAGSINNVSGNAPRPWPWPALFGPYSGLLLDVSGTSTSSTGIQSVTCNGTALALAADGSFSFPVLLASGPNTITVVATDKTGQQTSANRTIHLSPSAPTLTVTSPADGTATRQTAVTITGTTTANTTVAVKVNNGIAQPATMNGTNFTESVNLTAGFNTIELTATDSASATGSVKLTLVNNPAAPDLAISAPARDIITASSILALTGAVSSSASPVTVSIAFDGQTFTPPVINGAFQQQLTLATEKVYGIVVTATDVNAQSSVAQRNIIYSLTASGDVNGDGQVTVADALLAIKAAVNIITPTADELRMGNVAPLVQGVPAPDGSLNIQDALLILRKAVGLAW